MTTENTKVFDFIDALEALLYEWWDGEWGYNYDDEGDGLAISLYVGNSFHTMQEEVYRDGPDSLTYWDRTPTKEKHG